MSNPPPSRRRLLQVFPFLGAAVLWGLLGSAVVYWTSPPETESMAMGWWFGFFLFALVDLGVLAGLVVALVAGPPLGDRIRWGVRLAFLGALKVALLIGAGVLVTGNHGIPSPSLLSGLGTLIVVPLLGGGLWSFLPPERE